MTVAAAGGQARLAHFPIAFFAVTMGLFGLTLALHAAEGTVPGAAAASIAMLWASAAVLAAIAVLYAAKWVLHGREARAEWGHPVRIAFFPAISISLLLLATALLPSAPEVARAVWIAGAAAQGALTLAVVSTWIGERTFGQQHLSPAWFIPAVGNVIVPLAGAPLGFLEISWLFFSAGLVFWIVLLTLVFNRLVFHAPLPGRLYPTLVILVAPPAVAFVAWLKLTGEVDAFARILLNAGYVFAAIVAVQLPRILRLPFALPFWALSFPVAALSIASFAYAREAGSEAHAVVGTALLAILALTVVALVGRTAVAIARGEICRPE